MFVTTVWFLSIAITVDYYLLLLVAGSPVAGLVGFVAVGIARRGFPHSTYSRVCTYAVFLSILATLSGITTLVLMIISPWMNRLDSGVAKIGMVYVAYLVGGIVAEISIHLLVQYARQLVQIIRR